MPSTFTSIHMHSNYLSVIECNEAYLILIDPT